MNIYLFLIHSPVEKHLDCLQLLLSENHVSMDINVQVSENIYSFILNRALEIKSLRYKLSLLLAFFNLFFYTAGYLLSILYILVYICQSQYLNSSHHHLPLPLSPPWCPLVCSLHLCLYFCTANRFICTIFLGSTYIR